MAFLFWSFFTEKDFQKLFLLFLLLFMLQSIVSLGKRLFGAMPTSFVFQVQMTQVLLVL